MRRVAEIKGIDVSQYQGKIDWEKVKASGIGFAMIRVGWVDNIILREDTCFRQNMQGAISAGIPVGVYAYSYVTNPDSAKAAAERVKEAIKPYKLSWPVAFDIEDTQKKYHGGLSKAENTAIAKAFCEGIRAGGYLPMVYTYTYFADTYLNMEALSGYEVWIADYRGYVGYGGKYSIWQYSSSGNVDGIRGKVDLDTSFRDYSVSGKPSAYAIKVGMFLTEADARETSERIAEAGYYNEVKREGELWYVLSYSYTDKAKAEALAWLFTNKKYSIVIER